VFYVFPIATTHAGFSNEMLCHGHGLCTNCARVMYSMLSIRYKLSTHSAS